VPRKSGPKRGRKSLPAHDLTVAPWPVADPACLLCELTTEQWSDVHRMIFEERKDVFIVDDHGYLYPVELRHVTTGPSGLSQMLRRVKRDARRESRSHSHTSLMRPRYQDRVRRVKSGGPARRGARAGCS